MSSSKVCSQSPQDDTIFQLYTDKSWDKLIAMEKEFNKRSEVKKVEVHLEGKLVDGELQFVENDANIEPNIDLVEGKELNELQYGEIPKEFVGKPIEEIDHNIKNKTFVIVSSRFKKRIIYRYSASKAFFLLGPLNPIRRLCIRITTSVIFDYFIIATILVNCIFMTFQTEYDTAEYVFLSIYTLEMLFKLLARGFMLNPHTYLRDAWNWLDIIVVLSSYTMIVTESVSSSTNNNINVRILRTFRVIRVLKTISLLPGLKTIIETLLKSMKRFAEVIVLTLFFITIFALFGKELYMGMLRNKCVLNINWSEVNLTATNFTNHDAYYNWYINQKENWMKSSNVDYILCGNNTGAARCANSVYAGTKSWICLSNIGENPNGDYTNFDNFGTALLNSFQLITLDYMDDIYKHIIRAGGSWNIFFFIAVVFFGSYYLTNLMLAVVNMSYDEEARQRDKFQMNDIEKNLKKKKTKTKTTNHLIKSKHQYNIAKKINKGRDDGVVNSIVDNKKDEMCEKQTNVLSIQNEIILKQCSTTSDTYEQDNISIIEIQNKDRKMSFSSNITLESMNSIVDSGISSQDMETKTEKNSNEDVKNSGDNTLSDRNCFCFSRWDLCRESLFKAQKVLNTLSTDPFFELFIISCIFINTIIMAIDHHGNSQTYIELMDYSNTFFTVIFLMEAIIKLLSLGQYYFQSGWNIFDLIVVILCLIDLGVDSINGLSVFRTFRLFRVFKLAQSWGKMRILISIIFSSIGIFANITLILFLVIFIFAIIGKQLFGGSFTADVFGSDDNIPRWNFENFPHSFLMIFRIVCGGWTQTMWTCIQAKGKICLTVFIPTLVVGNFMVLNLFLAVLLYAFDPDSLKQEENDDSKLTVIFNRMRKLLKWNRVGTAEKTDDDPFHVAEKNIVDEDSLLDKQKQESCDDNETIKEKVLNDCCCLVCYRCCCCGTSFFTSSYAKFWVQFRYVMLKVADHKMFEGIILFTILSSSISLTFEDIYLAKNVKLQAVLYYFNFVYAAIFTVEMIIKLVAFGFKTYFSTFWTILDFSIVCVSYMDIISDYIGSNNFSAFRSLRALRALRPLRAISYWQGMRIVVNALLFSISSIGNVVFVCMMIWLIFGITGVQFFKGKFYHCQDSNQTDLSYLITPNKSECLRLGYFWNNRKINFDNVAQGFLALYQVATFEGWIEIMRDAIDVTDVDLQPIRESSMAYYAYFIIFIVVCAYFAMNLIIGVIIDNFNALKNKYEGNHLDMYLTPRQQNYYSTLKKLVHKKPHRTIHKPKNNIIAFFYNISFNNKFEKAILILIFLNMITFMIEHYNQPDYVTRSLEMINLIFTTIYICEAIFKIIGMQWNYFGQVWNVYDLVIIFLSILSLIINAMESYFVTPNLLRVIRIFKIGRVLRLVKAAKGIRKLLFAFIISLPALFNIGALLFLVLFIYAIIGMSIFANVKHDGNIDDIVNFENFERSMLLLFRLSTSAGWNDVLDSLSVSLPNCNSSFVTRANGEVEKVNNGDCGIDWFASIYMCTFVFLTYLIIVNMYIAIILNNFAEAYKQEEIGITEDDFDSFYLIWEKYDPHATHYIKYEQLSDFVAELNEPLGIAQPNVVALVSLNLPIVEGEKLHCIDVLKSLVQHVLGEVELTEEYKEMIVEMEKKYQTTFPSRLEIQVVSTTMRRKKEDIAAKLLQRAWRCHKMQRTLHNLKKNVVALAEKPWLLVGAPAEQNFGSDVSLFKINESAESLRNALNRP